MLLDGLSILSYKNHNTIKKTIIIIMRIRVTKKYIILKFIINVNSLLFGG